MIRTLEFANYTDEELIDMMRQGNGEVMDYLLQKHKGLVRKISNQYYLIGADSEDLVQEGMIGLFKAIRTYADDRGCTFYSFATRCIQGEIYTAIRSSQSKKHQPLNNSESISQSLQEGSEELDRLFRTSEILNPEQMVLESEFVQTFGVKLREQLSDKEWDVLSLFWQGMRRSDIAEQLEVTEKATDNALTRAKVKIRQILGELSVYDN